MKSFELSKNLDKNKVFLVNLSELDQSFSPLYYKSLPVKLECAKKLKEVAFINPQRKIHIEDKSFLIPYIGLPETDEHSRSVISVIQRPYKEVVGRGVIQKDDILFARIEPSVFNKKYIFANDLKGFDYAFTSTEFYIVKAKEELNQKFLFYTLFTDFVYNQVAGKTTGSTGRRRLDKSVFENLLIPIPPKEIQEKVVRIMDEAYFLKKQNEAKAEELLASIDDYLMKELGIELPQEQENTLKSRMFFTNLSEVSGGRFDPFCNQECFKALKNLKSKYDVKRIKEINEEIKTGLPVRKDFRVDGGNYPYYGANGIIGYMDEYTHNGLYLVIGQDGYIGNHYVVDGKFWGSNHNWVMKLKSGYEYYFVKAVLDMLKYDYLITGGVIPKLTKEALESIRIPVPPISTQKEIANHITNIRKQAQELKDQAKSALEQANRKIEEILLK